MKILSEKNIKLIHILNICATVGILLLAIFFILGRDGNPYVGSIFGEMYVYGLWTAMSYMSSAISGKGSFAIAIFQFVPIILNTIFIFFIIAVLQHITNKSKTTAIFVTSLALTSLIILLQIILSH